MAAKNNFGQCITYSQMNMISNSRFFWRRFTTWLRTYIISRYAGIGTEEDAFKRLYFETSGIGNLLQIVFERESSNSVSQLFNQITFALRDLITAQLQGNSEAVVQNVNHLYAITENFASFLASINPYIDEAEWRNMLQTYIRLTLEEVNSYFTNNYSSDIPLSESITVLTNRMGDDLAQAINDYIISGYSLSPQSNLQCITYDQMDQIYTIMMFWYELFTWTRAYMLSRYMGIGNAGELKAHLNQIIAEYIDALQQLFGVNLEGYLQLLNTYVDLIDNLITAQIEGNVDEINRIVRLLYQNADQRASQIASLNPFWNENEWKNRLYSSIHSTINQSTTFLTGDYASNSDTFMSLLDLAENTSSYYAHGLFNYLLSQ